MSVPVSPVGRVWVPVEPEGRTWERSAFVTACVCWAQERRPDLRKQVLWLAAMLCGDDWRAANARGGRKAWRRLVLRDIEEAAEAWRCVFRDEDHPELLSPAIALCIRAVAEGARPERPLWREGARRRVGRAIRRTPRWSLLPGDARPRSAPGFRAAVALTAGACPLVAVSSIVQAAHSPWPVATLADRSPVHLARLLLDMAVFHHHHPATRRHYRQGSWGNDILDRAHAQLEGERGLDALRALFTDLRSLGGRQ